MLSAQQIQYITFLSLELDKDEQQHGDPRAEPRSAGLGERWQSAPFCPNSVQYQGEDDDFRDG